MKNLPFIDLAIIIIYLLAMVLIGFYFSRKNKNSDQFTKASGNIPGWAIGLSIYATFLSSNTFLGVPGKAFGSNWNAFVFSISMPLAAWWRQNILFRFTGVRAKYQPIPSGKTFRRLGKNLCRYLFFAHAVCKNGFNFFWNGIKPAGINRIFNGIDHDSDGNLYYHLYCIGRYGSGDMDGSSAGNY